MDNAEWEQTNDIFRILQLLSEHGKLTESIWRRFHSNCCRDIWPYISNPVSIRAVEVAEQYISGAASLQDLQSAYINAKSISNAAWSVVESCKIARDSNAWLWPLTDETDEAWVRYCSAQAAAQCAETPSYDVLATTIPDCASSVRPWANARLDVLGVSLDDVQNRSLVEARWHLLENMEKARQADILRKIVPHL